MDTLLWIPYLAFTSFVVLLVKLWMKNRGLPPGPWGLPILGYYPFITSRPYVKLAELSKHYGKVLSFRSVGGTLFVVLNDLALVKEVLVDRDEEFTGRPLEANILGWLDDGLGIATTERSTWKEQRRFYLSTVKNFGYGKTESEGFMHELLSDMIAEIKEAGSKSVELSSFISYFTCNVISNILCKKTFAKTDQEYQQLVEGMRGGLQIFADPTYFIVGPPLDYGVMKLTRLGREAVKMKKTLLTFVLKIIKEHVETFDPTNLRDFVDSYLGHIKNLEQKGQLLNSSFSMKRLEMIFFAMLGEGTETTGYILNSLVLELARQPEAQKKIQEEIDEIIGDRLPFWEDRPSMPHTTAIILELFRIAWPFLFSSYYSNFEEAYVRGYRIPKRSIIVFNFYAIYHDPKLFPEPSKFNAQRFIGPGGEKIKLAGPIPFGIGKRNCVGEPLAHMEVFLFITRILQAFTLKAAKQTGHVYAVPRQKERQA